MSVVLDCLVAPAPPPDVPLVDQSPAVVYLRYCFPAVPLFDFFSVPLSSAAALHV